LVVRAPLPPMAATAVTDLPVGDGWVYDPKFDGLRPLAFCRPSGVRLQSRQQRWLTSAFPDITATLAVFADERVVLDGGLVVWQQGGFDFAALQNRLRFGPTRTRTLAAAAPAAFVAYDLLAHRDRTYTGRVNQTRGSPFCSVWLRWSVPLRAK
jgi:ATP-dependent DNA ligase